MKIFVTGASGFIGKHIVKKLLDAEYGVTALILPDEPETIMGDMAVNIVKGDIAETKSISGLMADHQAVIHLAGAVGYGQTMENCLRLNRAGTENVANEAMKSGARRFIHFSSVSVYGRVPDVPINESFPMKKTGDPYGDTKIDAELILLDSQAKGKLNLTILRPTVIYGPGDRLFLPKVVENIKARRARVIGKGDNTVDLIHVQDVADCVVRILKDNRSIGQTYNLTNSQNPSWKKFWALVSDIIGAPAPKKHLPYRLALLIAGLMELRARLQKKEPRLTRYSVKVVGRKYKYLTDKIRNELRFEATMDLKTEIKKILNDAQDNLL